MKHPARADLLACTYGELSVDTPLNRVLRAGVRRLVLVARSAGNRRTLGELVARFEAVSDSSTPLSEPVNLDRTNATFHRLYALARLLLAGDWQSTSAGRREGFGMLFAMNDLFEAFIGRSMKATLARRTVDLQRADRYALEGSDHGRLFKLKPDIVVDDDVVIDTKWKTLDPGRPTLGVAESDVYQMLAYSRAYRSRRLVLLYPWHEGLGVPGVCRSWYVSGTRTLFDVATVDVGRPDAVGPALRQIVDGAV